MVKTIGNPGTWLIEAFGGAASHVPEGLERVGGHAGPPQIRSIGQGDIRAALRAGFEDFGEFRTDVIFACLIYPAIGLILAWFAFDRNLLPLLFPLAAGFVLLGPVAAIGLYEMSRRRAAGHPARWSDGFAVAGTASVVPILILAAILGVLFLMWLGAAALIYNATLGPEPPEGALSFLSETLTTGAGWAMIVIGCGVGFLFAVAVLAISLISFPLLVDRDVGLSTAIATSIAVARQNPVTVAQWGALVAVTLAVASIPVFIGLIIALPVLGHATWHLYARAVDRDAGQAA